MKRIPIWRWVAVACHLSAVLAPGAWLYFARHAGSSFSWAGFAGKNLLICLALTLVPTVLFFLAGLLQRRHRQAAWGSLLASLFFLLAAAGWLYTLCDSWNLWSAARAASLLTAGQLRALQAAAITGAVGGLLPLLSQIPAALHRK